MRGLLRLPIGLLALAVLLLAVAGCGDDDTGPSPNGEDGGQWRLVEIVSESAVGGRVDERPSRIGTRAELRAFASQFTRRSMTRGIRAVVEGHDTAPGRALVAAVVWIGCETPAGVAYENGRVTASPAPKETVQCLVPVTSVAVLEVVEPLSDAG